jgi:hypothetical protein
VCVCVCVFVYVPLSLSLSLSLSYCREDTDMIMFVRSSALPHSLWQSHTLSLSLAISNECLLLEDLVKSCVRTLYYSFSLLIVCPVSTLVSWRDLLNQCVKIRVVCSGCILDCSGQPQLNKRCRRSLRRVLWFVS